MKEKFESSDIDAEGLMNLAEYTPFLMNEFGESRDPYTILKSMSVENYKRILASNFATESKHIDEIVPPLLFRYDFIVLIFFKFDGGYCCF